MKKTQFGCVRCAYISKDKIDMQIKETVKEAKPVGVVNEKEGEMNPITDYHCDKCGHNKAYFWIRQMRAGDEAESKFYKCVKCKRTVRVDD